MRNRAKLLLATAEKVSTKTVGILLGLCVGASASGLIFLPTHSPAPQILEETFDSSIDANGIARQPSSSSRLAQLAPTSLGKTTSSAYNPNESYGYSQGSYSQDAMPLAADASDNLPGFVIGGMQESLSAETSRQATNYDNNQTSSPSSDSSGTNNSSASSGTTFVGGTGGATDTDTASDTTSSYTRYLSVAALASSVYSGDTLASSLAVEIRRSDTYSQDSSWADQLSVAAYSNSACTTAATGTLSATPASLAMSSGAATVTNIIYTATSAETEETIYLKFTAATAAVSRCSSAVYVKQKFNSGTGYSLFQHGGTGASGRVAASKSDIPIDSTLDSQNRIVVVGVSLNAAGRHELALWRYLPNGSLDTSFAGGNGFFTFQPGGTGAAGALNANKFDFPGGNRSLVIDSQGRILVAGTSRNAVGSYEATIWRFEEDGDLDTTFAGTGFTMFQPGGAGATGAPNAAKYDEGNALFIDSAGRYILIGDSNNALGGGCPILIRFLEDGTVDTSYGTGGVAALGDGTAGYGGKTNATKTDWVVTAESLSNGGYLLAGGSDTSAGSNLSILWKVTSTGSLDTSFGGGDGWMQMNEGGANIMGAAFASREDGVNDIQVDSSGKITVLMYGNTAAGYYEVGLTRLNSDGSADTSFGTTGSTTVLPGGRTLAGTSLNKKYDVPSRLFFDSSNRIVLTSMAHNESWGTEPVIVRLTNAGALDTTFSGDGIFTYAQNNAVGPGGASAAAKGDGRIRPTIDGTQWNFLSQIPLLIDGAGRYLMPFAAGVAASPAAELAIYRINPDATIDQ